MRKDVDILEVIGSYLFVVLVLPIILISYTFYKVVKNLWQM